MYPFTIPDYRGGSIVNLMSSVIRSFGGGHEYSELSELPSSELSRFRNTVLIVIDGLGANYLSKQNDSFLNSRLSSRLTSVFLSTTACANTVFSFGYPPQQHGFTGWDMNLKETGAVTTILPFIPRYEGESLEKSGFSLDMLDGIPAVYTKLKARSSVLIRQKIAHSPFSDYASRGADVVPVRNLRHGIKKILPLIKQRTEKRKYLHLYIEEFDSAAHKHGVQSGEVRTVFEEIDREIRNLSVSLKNTGTALLVTSDHGFIDVPEESIINSESVPGFSECLTIPLSGDSRTRYCYVRPEKTKKFEDILNSTLSGKLWWYRGSKLIRDYLYGLGEPHRNLYDRVGDYVLVMKENFIIQDKLANARADEKHRPGRHGGVSEDEMAVPLITIL
ncbi:MAG: alkaline phosphatase family protein [Spirochaetia bacterium]